jgi:hypothetical protein
VNSLVFSLQNRGPLIAVLRRPALTVFVTSIVVTLFFWLILPTAFKGNDSSDYTDFYEPVARNILAGRGVVLGGEPALRTPPGYPLVLASLFALADLLELNEAILLSAFNLLTIGFASVLVHRLARSIWGSLPAFLAAIGWLTYPFNLWLTKQPNSELPFLIAFYGGIGITWYALIGGRRSLVPYFTSGILFGVAMLIRPIAIGVGLVMCAIVWLAARNLPARFRLFCVGMVVLGNLVAVLPWEAWVYSQTGRVILLSTSGTSGIRSGLTFAIDLRGYRTPGGVPSDVTQLMQEISTRTEEMRSVSGIVAVMVDELQKHPLATAKLFAIKAVMSWYGTDTRRFDTTTRLLQIPYIALWLWATRQAWRLGGLPKCLAVSVWMLVLYFWIVTISAYPLLRYMVPGVGLLFLLLPACSPEGDPPPGPSNSDDHG